MFQVVSLLHQVFIICYLTMIIVDMIWKINQGSTKRKTLINSELINSSFKFGVTQQSQGISHLL